MKDYYFFIVWTNPVACARPRFGNGRVYMPTKTKAFQKHIAAAAAAAKVRCIGTPIYLNIYAYFEWPKSEQRKKAPRPSEPMPQKPDVDNIAKNVMDGLKDYFKDEQVTRLSITKRRAAQGEKARVEVYIQTPDA